jgi:hypothetical protein
MYKVLKILMALSVTESIPLRIDGVGQKGQSQGQLLPLQGTVRMVAIMWAGVA